MDNTIKELEKKEQELLYRMTIAVAHNDPEDFENAKNELNQVQDRIYNIEQQLAMAGWIKEGGRP